MQMIDETQKSVPYGFLKREKYKCINYFINPGIVNHITLFKDKIYVMYSDENDIDFYFWNPLGLHILGHIDKEFLDKYFQKIDEQE